MAQLAGWTEFTVETETLEDGIITLNFAAMGVDQSNMGTVFFKDVDYLYEVFCTLLFYLTPIFYQVEQLNIKNEIFKMVLMANPLYSITQMFRSCVLYGEMFNINHLLYSLAFGIVSVAIGLFAFYKKQDKFILHI